MLGGLSMEHKIGDIFEYKDVKLKCIEYYPNDNYCNDCYFYQWNSLCAKQKCTSYQRKDKTDVMFIQVK